MMGSTGHVGEASRRGKKVAEKAKQPQRGLGVAQLEKIRLQNQMMAAYHAAGLTQQDARMQLPFPAGPGGAPTASASAACLAGFHPYRTDGFEGTDHRRMDAQRYGSHASTQTVRNSYSDGENLPPYDSNRTAMKQPFFVHDMKDSDQSRRQGRHYWKSSSHETSASSSEELDLELRL